MSNQADKSVIVTGASSGIGETTAILFASRGYNVALCGRDSERLQGAAERCRQAAQAAGHAGTKAIGLAGDISEPAVRKRVVMETVEAFGALNTLVCNHAVVTKDDHVGAVTEENFDDMFNTNLKSVLFLIKEAVPYLERSGGSVICVSSIASSYATKGNLLLYSMTKASMDHMVRSLAVDLGPKGIRVNVVNPTYVKTRIFRNSLSREESDAAGQLFAKVTPMKDPVCSGEDVGEVILFLAGDKSRFINGDCIAVDGGLSCMGNPFNFV